MSKIENNEFLTEGMTKPFISVFAGDSTELINIAVNAMKTFIVMYAVGNVSTLVGGYYIAVDKPMLALLNSMARVIIFVVPMLFIAPMLFGLNGVWMAQPFADVLACILAVICISHEMKIMKNNEITL